MKQPSVCRCIHTVYGAAALDDIVVDVDFIGVAVLNHPLSGLVTSVPLSVPLAER